MRTFLEMTRGSGLNPARAFGAVRARLRAVRAGGEDGFLLIEVLMSAVLVAMIVTATFNGLDVATKVTSEQRHRNQAELLAAQSQEQLRSEPASALDELVSHPHTYTEKIGGVTYTIKQVVATVTATGKQSGCSVTEATAKSAGNFRTSSTVTWNGQEQSKREPVRQAAIVTPPIGSGIEVDVVDGAGNPVANVTAKAKFIPNESGSTTYIEGTTSSAGCVVLGGIQATEATVELLEKTGFVTPSGALVPEPRTLTIAPNITTHTEYKFAEAGAIQAQFTYLGKTEWESKPVTGDTFVVYQTLTGVEPYEQVGSTSFTHEIGGEEDSEAQTGTYAANSSFTAKQAKYPSGDLFPFSSPWSVWAGDCSANKETLASPGGTVVSGKTAKVEVPVAVTKLGIYTGSGPGKPGTVLAEGLKPSKAGVPEVKITNTGCASAKTPLNSTGLKYVHTQKETMPGSTKGGQLEVPFQPPGKFTLCMVYSAQKKTFSISYENKTAAPSEPKIYLSQRPTAEIVAERAEKESEYKANEAYKGAGGYSGAEAEVKPNKEKYEEWHKAWETDKAKYETEKNNYNTYKSKYNTEKTNWEVKKVEPYKKNYLEYEAKYKAAEKEYKTYETKYKTDETEYKKYETAYKTAEQHASEYQKYLKYTAALAAYEKAKTEEKEAAESGETVESKEEC